MKLLWLDLETTGLDPATDCILEIAAYTTELSDPFVITSERLHFVLAFHENHWKLLDPFVLKMHTENGLLAECGAAGCSLEIAEQALLSLIPRKEDIDRSDLTAVAGSSVHFDLGFLREHMPGLASHLSHRVYDVSAVALFCRSLGMPKLPRAEAHRAMADIDESMTNAKTCVAWLQNERQGLCRRCGGELDEPGFVSCTACRRKERKYEEEKR